MIEFNVHLQLYTSRLRCCQTLMVLTQGHVGLLHFHNKLNWCQYFLVWCFHHWFCWCIQMKAEGWTILTKFNSMCVIVKNVFHDIYWQVFNFTVFKMFMSSFQTSLHQSLCETLMTEVKMADWSWIIYEESKETEVMGLGRIITKTMWTTNLQPLASKNESSLHVQYIGLSC